MSADSTDAWAADTGGRSIMPRTTGRGRRAAMLDGYHDARQTAEADRENDAMGYATETSEYNRDHKMPSLFQHMKSYRGMGEDWGHYG